MKKLIPFLFSFLLFLFVASPTFADSTDFTVSNFTFDPSSGAFSFDYSGSDLTNCNDLGLQLYNFEVGTDGLVYSTDGPNTSIACTSSSVTGQMQPDSSYSTVLYPASHDLAMEVRTNDGGNITWNYSDSFQNPDYTPSIPINPLTGATITTGSTYNEFGYFTDWDASSTSWTATVDYGDGSEIQTQDASGQGGTEGAGVFTLNHQYNTAGTYTVTVNLTDNFGATATANATVIVNNPLPPSTGTINVSQNPVKINNTTTTTASFTDPAGGSSNTASWNWGDGSTTYGTVSESNGSGSVGPDSHIYTSLGSYNVTLTVTNGDDNLSGTSQTVIAVIPSGGLRGTNLTGKNYSGADLSGQNISGSNLSNGTFNNVNFSTANLSGSNGSLGSYTSSNFTSANLAGGNFSGANFTGSNFTSAILTGANVSSANFTNVNFTGANLKGSSFHGATTTGVTWSNTTCPNGTNSNNDDGTCVGQGGGL